MNSSQINGNSLNGPSVAGYNAILSGGMAIACLLASSLTIGAVLSDGVSSDAQVKSQFETRMQGGVYTEVSDMGGICTMTANLMLGVFSDCSVGGVYGFEPAMRDGVESPSYIGGQLVTNIQLQVADTVGTSSFVSGNLNLSDSLIGGVEGTSYMGGHLIGGVALMSDGLKSDCEVGGSSLIHPFLRGGLNTFSIVDGTCVTDVYLLGGLMTNQLVGKELDIQALLQSGISNSNAVNSPVMRISPKLQFGLISNPLLDAKIRISPNSNGGVDSNSSFDSRLLLSPVLQYGLSTNQFIGGNGITASQRLRGDVDTFSLVGGNLLTKIPLRGGATSSSLLGGDIAQGFLDPLLNSWALELRSATVKLEIFTPIKDI